MISFFLNRLISQYIIFFFFRIDKFYSRRNTQGAKDRGRESNIIHTAPHIYGIPQPKERKKHQKMKQKYTPLVTQQDA